MRRTPEAIAVVAVVLGLLGAEPGQASPECVGVAPTGSTSLTAVRVADSLPNGPLWVTAPPGDTKRLFIVERSGTVRVRHRGGGLTSWTTFLDISDIVNSESDGEMGLLGLAFAPDFATSGQFFVNYTEGPAGFVGPWFTVVARYEVSAGNPDAADAASEVRFLRFLQPQSNHNGGQLLFGPDGNLWIPTGDGGGGNDAGTGHAACGNAQSTGTLLGKVLRIDVAGSGGMAPDCGLDGLPSPGHYRIPPGNPMVDGAGGAACDEIWAIGLRNPWRNDFDDATGDLYIADVGQNCWEEVSVVSSATAAGANFGWRKMEGSHCLNRNMLGNCDPPGESCGLTPACGAAALTLPVHDYCHPEAGCEGPQGCAITGGAVYRGCLMPNLAGTYFYGDLCSGFVRSFRMVDGAATDHTDWSSAVEATADLPGRLASFGEDAQGEVYIVAITGEIYKLLPPLSDVETSGAGSASPLLVSDAGMTWENLRLATEHEVAFYRIYRGTPGDSYTCIHTSPVPSWSAGADPDQPTSGEVFAYIVTAVGPGGPESATGTSGFFDSSTCP